MDKNTADEGAIKPRSKKPSGDLPARPRHGKTPSRDRRDRSRLALVTAIITLIGALLTVIGALLPQLLH
jgi:hypothetical protein